MPKPEKVQKVEELVGKFGEAKSLLLTDYRGLNVEEISELRDQLRASSVEYRIVKNTLAKISAEQLDLGELKEFLDGPTAIAFGLDDPMASIKIINEFKKKKEKPTIKAYLLDGEIYGSSQVDELAKLPGKDVLLAQLLGTMNAPISNLVSSLNNLLQKMVYVLNAIKEQKEQQD